MADLKALNKDYDYVVTKLLAYIIGLFIGLFAWPAFAWLQHLI